MVLLTVVVPPGSRNNVTVFLYSCSSAAVPPTSTYSTSRAHPPRLLHSATLPISPLSPTATSGRRVHHSTRAAHQRSLLFDQRAGGIELWHVRSSQRFRRRLVCDGRRPMVPEWRRPRQGKLPASVFVLRAALERVPVYCASRQLTPLSLVKVELPLASVYAVQYCPILPPAVFCNRRPVTFIPQIHARTLPTAFNPFKPRSVRRRGYRLVVLYPPLTKKPLDRCASTCKQKSPAISIALEEVFAEICGRKRSRQGAPQGTNVHPRLQNECKGHFPREN